MSGLRPQFTIDQTYVRLSAQRPVRWERFTVEASIPPHDHEFIEICLIVKGTGLHVTEGGNFHLRANQVLILSPGCVHAFQKSHKLEVINIYFLPEWFLPEIQLNGEGNGILSLFFSGLVSSRREAHAFHEFAASSRVLREIMSELNDLATGESAKPSLWITCCFFKVLLLLVEAYRARTGARFSAQLPPTVWESFAEIDRVVRTGEKLDLPAFAKKTGMTHDHLGRIFRRQVGKTLTAFYQYRRLQFVCRLLLETDQTLSEIAYRLGYADQAHMCRLFRRQLALTPSSYRKQFSSSPAETL